MSTNIIPYRELHSTDDSDHSTPVRCDSNHESSNADQDLIITANGINVKDYDGGNTDNDDNDDNANNDDTSKNNTDDESESTMLKLSDTLQQSLVCGICMDKFYQPVTLICQHTFCKGCLMQSHDRKCPICKIGYVIPREYNRIIDTASQIFFHEEWLERDAELQRHKLKRDLRKEVEQELRNELFDQVVNIGLEEFRAVNSPRQNNILQQSAQQSAQLSTQQSAQQPSYQESLAKNIERYLNIIHISTPAELQSAFIILLYITKILIGYFAFMIIVPTLFSIGPFMYFSMFTVALFGVLGIFWSSLLMVFLNGVKTIQTPHYNLPYALPIVQVPPGDNFMQRFMN